VRGHLPFSLIFMKILQDYIVDDRLYVSDTGPEVKVGDQVRLFLDQEANPDFPEYIIGTIQHPIVRVNCDSSTSYVIEYNEIDLLNAASLIRPGDVIDAVITSEFQQYNIQTFLNDSDAALGGLSIGDIYFTGIKLRSRNI
jgi:hypothetical protein